MKLHSTAIEKILRIYENFGGTSDEKKLREKLHQLDLTPYEQKLSAGGNIVLVPTDDYELQLRNIPTKRA